MTARPTVLAIEDDLSSRRLLRTVIERARPDVRLLVVADGRTGLAAAEHYTPALILLDLHLAGTIDGRELLTVLKADPQTASIPVVMVTGDATAVDELRAAGAADVIVKPYDLERFTEQVLAHCP